LPPTSFPQQTTAPTKFLTKAKDREISELQYRLSQQDKTLQALRSQLSDSEMYKRFTDLQSQLKESTQKNLELSKQLRTMERIQQG